MFYFRKNGMFYENGFNSDAKEYIFTRVESFIPYLDEVIHIDYELTLEDFFNILEREGDIINIIFGSHMGHFPLGPYLDDIKRDCMPESEEDTEDTEDIEYIECCWTTDQFNYKKFYEKFKDKESPIRDAFGPLKEPEDDEVNEITIYIDVIGWGKFKPVEGETYKEGEAPTHMSYAIEFTPLYRLKHLPIRLNKEFIIEEEKYDNKKHVLVSGKKEFSVFELFGAILSEITFVGLPEERDDMLKDVIEEKERIEKEFESEEDDTNDENDDKNDDKNKK